MELEGSENSSKEKLYELTSLLESFGAVIKLSGENKIDAGTAISGSGPALFALSDSEEISRKVGIAMVESFRKNGLNSIAYPSPIHRKPPEILD